MKTLNELKEQESSLLNQRERLEFKRGDIYLKEQQAISDTVLPFFSEFTPEVIVEVTRGSVYFKMNHPDVNYTKELFSLYLRENWSFDEKEKAFSSINLSYYTTSTNGVDKWELNRLQLLGKAAEIVLNHQDRILDRVNNTVSLFKSEYNKVYSQMRELQKEIGEVQTQIRDTKGKQLLTELLNDGVSFEDDVYIELKRSDKRPTRFSWIKVTEVKGKTCTVSMKNDSYTHSEDRVNLEKLVSRLVFERD
jgi:uncharacterized coiled-coil protein SlyX